MSLGQFHDGEGDADGDWPGGRRRIDNALARRAISMVDQSKVVETLAVWKEEDRKGLGGRPETFSTRALLVAITLCALTDQPMQATRFCDVMFRLLSPAIQSELGIPDPPAEHDRCGWANAYRNVRTRFHHGICAPVDPSPRPKNRRLGDEAFVALTEQRRATMSAEGWERRAHRLTLILNLILESSITLVPRDIRRRWQGSVGVDATLVRSHARAERRERSSSRRGKARVEVHSADPDAGFYSRPTDERDAEGAITRGKLAWGHEATLAVSGPDDPEADHGFPHLVVGMAPLHRPGSEVGKNAIAALQSVRGRGHPANFLAADRAYSSAKAEDFQLPARALGYRPLYDYKIDQLGVRASWQGFVQIEGDWYCPAIPQPLIDATLDLREGRIEQETYRKRLEERWQYRARPKGHPDAEGHLRFQCPAASPWPLARCERKPASIRPETRGRVLIPVKVSTKEHFPPSCSQHSVTIAPEAGAKFAQELVYGSDEWHTMYSTLRNTNEGMHGFVKDGAHEALDDPRRRRLLGTAAQSILVAFLLMAANVRKITTFLQGLSRIEQGILPRGSRRRRTKALSTWRPKALEAQSLPGPDPPVTA